MLWEWQDGRTEEGRRERKEIKEEGEGKKEQGLWATGWCKHSWDGGKKDGGEEGGEH